MNIYGLMGWHLISIIVRRMDNIINYSIILVIFLFLAFYAKRIILDDKTTEGFANQSFFNKQPFSDLLPPSSWSNFQYLKDPRQPIIRVNRDDYPIFRFSLYPSNSYDEAIYQYMRHKVYPMSSKNSVSAFDTLYQFQKNMCDIAFISEEVLFRYFMGDDRRFEALWKDLFKGENKMPNMSAVGVGYYEYFYMFCRDRQDVKIIEDILDERIGICGDDYYYFSKFMSMKNIEVSQLNITTAVTVSDLINKFKDNLIDAVFVVSHPKNNDLRDVTRTVNTKFLPIMNIDLERLYKKYFATAIPKVEDLNRFYRSNGEGNRYKKLHRLEKTPEGGETDIIYYSPEIKNPFANAAYPTLGIRTVLVVKNDLLDRSIRYLTNNYIDNLIKMRDKIDKDNYVRLLNNFDPRDFKYEEMVSFHRNIPLNPIARNIWMREGMIYDGVKMQCKNENFIIKEQES